MLQLSQGKLLGPLEILCVVAGACWRIADAVARIQQMAKLRESVDGALVDNVILIGCMKRNIANEQMMLLLRGKSPFAPDQNLKVAPPWSVWLEC